MKTKSVLLELSNNKIRYLNSTKVKKTMFNLYVSNCLKTIEKELNTLKKQQKSESFHQLRVQVKKIRALLHFINSIYSYPGGIRILKPIFKKAGQIRELQINSKLLQKLHNPPLSMVKDMARKENNHQRLFIKNIPGYIDIVKRLDMIFDAPLYLPKKKTAKKYFQKQIRKASHKFNMGSKKGLHQLRTQLKTLMYVYKALPDNIQKSLNLNASHVNKLQHRLGLWHDTYSAIGFFSNQHFRDKKNFITKLKARNRELYRDILYANLKMKKS